MVCPKDCECTNRKLNKVRESLVLLIELVLGLVIVGCIILFYKFGLIKS
jgi:hypothetical protein